MDAAADSCLVAFRTLFFAEAAYVRRVLWRMAIDDRHLDVLVQDVFLVAFQKQAMRADPFDVTRSVKPWLCAIASHVGANFRRRASERHEFLLGDASPEPRDEQGRRQVEARMRLATGLDALNDEERLVVLACDLEGHAVTETAAEWGIKEGTLYSRLSVARQKMRSAIQAAERVRVAP